MDSWKWLGTMKKENRGWRNGILQRAAPKIHFDRILPSPHWLGRLRFWLRLLNWRYSNNAFKYSDSSQLMQDLPGSPCLLLGLFISFSLSPSLGGRRAGCAVAKQGPDSYRGRKKENEHYWQWAVFSLHSGNEFAKNWSPRPQCFIEMSSTFPGQSKPEQNLTLLGE